MITENDLDKVLVLDVETSGIDPIEHGLLSIGAVWLTNLTATFYTECRIDDTKLISLHSLEVNGFTEEQCRDKNKQSEYDAVQEFLKWVESLSPIPCKDIIIAGENPSFDKLFVQLRLTTEFQNSCNWMKWPFSIRMVDLHSVAFGRYFKSMRHSGISKSLLLEPEDNPHHALKGAMSEAHCFRKFFGIDPIMSHEGSKLWEDHK